MRRWHVQRVQARAARLRRGLEVVRLHHPAVRQRGEEHDRILLAQLEVGLVADESDVPLGHPGHDAHVLDVGHRASAREYGLVATERVDRGLEAVDLNRPQALMEDVLVLLAGSCDGAGNEAARSTRTSSM